MPVDKKFEADGVTINKEKALAMIEQYNTPEKVAAGLEELKATWDRLLSVINVDTPDDKVNRMVNIWNQYQCMVTFNLSRSASYFESGIGRGMGFRDSNQDILGFVHQIPDRARQRIIDIASTQLPDGGCYHQYQPLTKKGNSDIGGDFSDDPLWMILQFPHTSRKQATGLSLTKWYHTIMTSQRLSQCSTTLRYHSITL